MNMYRWLVLIAVMFSGSAWAVTGVPQVMNLNGHLWLDSADAENSIDLTVTLWNDATATADANKLFTETQTVLLSSGRFFMMLGTLVDNPVPIEALSGNVYVGVKVDEGAELTPRLKMASVPFAFQAMDAETLDGNSATYFATADHVHALGQLTGTLPSGAISGTAPVVIAGSNISLSACANNNEILKWNATNSVWQCTADEVGESSGAYDAGTGLQLVENPITGLNTRFALMNCAINGGVLTSDGTGGWTCTGLAGDVTGALDATVVSKLQGKDMLIPTTITDGYVLKWNLTNSRWEPSADLMSTPGVGSVSQIIVGSGLSVSPVGGQGNVTISPVFGTTSTQIAVGNHTHIAQGDVTGTLGNAAATMTLATSGVTAGSYGNTGNNVANIAVDAKGRVTGAANRAITPANIGAEPAITAGTADKYWNGIKSWTTFPTALPPNGAAGGDLTGSSYPNPTIAPNAVTTTKILDDAVTAAKIADNSIIFGNLATAIFGATATTISRGDHSHSGSVNNSNSMKVLPIITSSQALTLTGGNNSGVPDHSFMDLNENPQIRTSYANRSASGNYTFRDNNNAAYPGTDTHPREIGGSWVLGQTTEFINVINFQGMGAMLNVIALDNRATVTSGSTYENFENIYGAWGSVGSNQNGTTNADKRQLNIGDKVVGVFGNFWGGWNKVTGATPCTTTVDNNCYLAAGVYGEAVDDPSYTAKTWAGFFKGDVNVTGTLTAPGGMKLPTVSAAPAVCVAADQGKMKVFEYTTDCCYVHNTLAACMKTGAATYAWQDVKTTTWGNGTGCCR